ncbi:MAG: proline dehydrogenase family protein [Spirochaetia bacterium]|jgi:RHH-type proline utilization regulon transcriptional repressor/proline dehydrogenase/delta 1-pyrroline-5-carboxylate dehydrogenase
MEAQILELAKQLHGRARPAAASFFDRIMDAAIEDDDLKADLFRLLDVLPMLTSDDEVSRHVREYLLSKPRKLPALIAGALQAAGTRAFSGVASKAIRGIATQMAERFIVGAALPQAIECLAKLHDAGFAFSADLLGESTVSEAEGAAFQKSYSQLIETLSIETRKWAERPLVDAGHPGPFPRTNVSLKLSSFTPRLDPLDHAGSVERLARLLCPLFLTAQQQGAALVIDMEQWDLHGIAWDVFETLVMRPELAGWPHFGIVVQAYLTAAHDDVQRLLALARRRGAPLSVRLVKGAYWDFEVAHARQHGYPYPVLMGKSRTDASFEKLSECLLRNTSLVYPGIGSHNLRSISHAIVAARNVSAPQGSFELQVLYGMAEAQRFALRDLGHRVRVYAPVGELLPGIAYLVRRLLENSANTGFLRQSRNGKSIEDLAAPPTPAADEITPSSAGNAFVNCSHADFTDGNVRQRFSQSLEAERALLPVVVPVCVGGARRTAGRQLVHVCPGSREQKATLVTCGTSADVEKAVDTAQKAWPGWRDKPVEDRAAVLLKLADLLERDRFDCAALQCLEVGKPIREADADVAEAIDMCRYYARMARTELGARRRSEVTGEDNLQWYEGRGVAAVIAPWNFPLAILCGMATAALVSGNAVIMKPAEQSSGVALRLYEALEQCGLPGASCSCFPARETRWAPRWCPILASRRLHSRAAGK